MSKSTHPLSCCDAECAAINHCRIGGYECPDCGCYYCPDSDGMGDENGRCVSCAERFEHENEEDN